MSTSAAGRVRSEDAFDIGHAAAWVREHASDATGLDGDPEVRQFAGGASNLTYLLRWPARELVLRRPPAGTKAKGAHDMRREHDLQAALRPVFPLVPAMVGYCGDEAVIGSEFYVMERIEGTIVRTDLPADLGLEVGEVRTLCENAIDVLVTLHGIDVARAGLAALDRGDGYVARQVGGWAGRFRRARTPDVPDHEATMSWLEEHRPPDRPHTLIHNDFRFDNLVLAPDDPTRVAGVLDWELATVGDPLMDLGATLAYWVQADDDPGHLALRLQPTHTPGMLTRDEVVARYCAALGLDLSDEDRLFYEVFGLFRLAAIAQQIYYRFHHGQTTNAAYGAFRDVVAHLDRRCAALLAG